VVSIYSLRREKTHFQTKKTPSTTIVVRMSFNYPIAIPWIIFGVIVVATTIFLTIVTLVLKYREEKAKIPVLVTILGLLAICFCLFLIPVDIFNVSQQEDPTRHSVIIKWVYYGSYLTLLIFAFVLIPFAYFFFEEGDEEVGIQSSCALTVTYIHIFLTSNHCCGD
jgi:LMBR1 domain-containing protein 1